MVKKHSIFHSTSFHTLSEEQKKVVRTYVEAKSTEDLPKIDTTEIFRNQNALATPLAYYGQKIEQINPVAFQYMTEVQRQSLQDELYFAFYIFSARYQLDYAEGRGRFLSERADQIKNCAFLLNTLRTTPPINVKELPEQQLMQSVTHGDSPVKYLVMQTISPLVLEIFGEISDRNIKTGLEWMGAFNERRLYWVWAGGGGLLGTILKLLPDNFYNKTQAQSILDLPAPYTGSLSWILYYFRLGVSLSLFAKHVVPGPWMSEEEYTIPWHERFVMQWNIRKFSLLNDFFWAGANLVCFFWLVGAGMPGYYGGALTGLLLVMDVSLSIWNFQEESAQYHQDMERYRQDIVALLAIKETKNSIEQPVVEQQIKVLYDARRKCKLDWDYKLYGLYSDAMYAVALFAAFALLSCAFFPPAAVAPATVLICGVIGTVLCFAMNAFFSAVRKGIEVSKSVEISRFETADKQILLQRFISLDNDFDKRQCYLDLKLLDSKSEYQQQVILYQKMTLLRSVLIDTLVPPLIFAGLVLVPLGIGIPFLALGFALAVASYYYVEANYKPGNATLPGFDEVEFAAFNPVEALNKLTHAEPSLGFFGFAGDCLRDKEKDPLFLNSPPEW